MMQYWQNLQARDQRTLIIGGVAVTLLLIYSLVIDPFAQEVERLEKSVAADRELLAWMEQSAKQVKQLRGSAKEPARSNQSLLSLVDASAKQGGLGKALKQVKPEGTGVRLRLEEASFDELAKWLGRLGTEQGVNVTTLTLNRTETEGKVNVTVVLERGAG